MIQGEIYLRQQDPHSAKICFEAAAELGHIKANGKLGRSPCLHPFLNSISGQMYYMGDGVSTDYDKGFHYLLIAADAKDVTARYNIGLSLKSHFFSSVFPGLMYYHGRGVTQSKEKAQFYYTLAADAGHRGAQNNLGMDLIPLG